MRSNHVVDNDGRRIAEVAEEILGYLKSHPHAADTLHGITDWWVMRQRLNVSMDVVRAALDRLEQQGSVTKSKVAGGDIVYGSGKDPA